MSGFPEAAAGTAAGVLVFSTLCLLCSIIMVWLVWSHREWDSFVGFLTYFPLLSTLASMIQQIHTIVAWEAVKTAQWENSVANAGSVEVAISGASTGIDLGLFYIQYYSYSAEAMLVLFWAGSLAHSIFGITSFKALHNKANPVSKIIAVVLPAIFLSLLAVPGIKDNAAAFLVLANITMLFSLSVGAVLMLTILGKYIHTRRAFLSWNVQYGKSSNTKQQSQQAGNHYTSAPRSTKKSSSIYDRWLMVRFTIAFVMLGVFELVIILFQLNSARNTSSGNTTAAPDLSAAKASSDFVSFMPGCVPGVLVFIVFGTSRPFREHMAKTFIPKRFRNEKPKSDAIVANVYSSQAGKTWHTTSRTDEGPDSPREDGNTIIRLREVELRDSIRDNEEDEWPILNTSTATRINGQLV
ncbi:hypothetical protein BX600DRAFT_131645 [Xylariales sp. PMI_506]|nr:hypothetical protein BX600DRAFT_131645 [Xylariales sp. PMI_506]